MKFITQFILLLLLITSLSSPTFAALQCAGIFPISAKNQTLKNSVKASIQALAEFRITIDLAKIQGSSSIEKTALENDYVTKEKELLSYLAQNQIMGREEFLKELKKTIVKSQQKKGISKEQEKEQRIEKINQQLQAIKIDGSKGIFHPIEPGEFEMISQESDFSTNAAGYERVKVTLTKPFQMMATLTTQVIWRSVIELSRSKKKESLEIDPSEFKGDLRPVETVSKFDIHIWLELLNELSKKDHPALAELFPGHKKGHIYRLPTSAEWEFVLTQGGVLKDEYFFGTDKSQIDHYIWHAHNSKGETQPVAMKAPLVFNGREFYDMLGNVSEYMADDYTSSVKGGDNPIMRGYKTEALIRGASFEYNESFHTVLFRSSTTAALGNNDDGFRLVREVRK